MSSIRVFFDAVSCGNRKYEHFTTGSGGNPSLCSDPESYFIRNPSRRNENAAQLVKEHCSNLPISYGVSSILPLCALENLGLVMPLMLSHSFICTDPSRIAVIAGRCMHLRDPDVHSSLDQSQADERARSGAS